MQVAWYGRSMWRWLSADPRDVVDLAGAGAAADSSEELNLGDELRRWRGIVGRRRLIALLRRHAAVALVLAALLQILAQLDLVSQVVAIAVPVVLFLVSVTFFALRGPSPFGLARLLDDKLGLNDRLATALGIQARGGGVSYLERRTVGDAAGLLRAGRQDWHASAVKGERDWWALAVPVVAIAAVIGIGSATAGDNSATGPETALGPGGGAGTGNGPNERHRKREREKERREKHLAPTGKLHKFKGGPRRHVEASQEQIAKQGYRKIPQGTEAGKENGRKAGSKEGKAGKAPTGKIHKGAGGKPGSERGGNKSGSRGPQQTKEKEHPTVGFNVKGEKHDGTGRKGNSEVSGGGNKKPAAPNGKQDESSFSASESKKGIPSGAGKAGGEQGNNQQGHATPIKGKASQSVKIQPGYAPSRSPKGGQEHRKAGNQQGAGGKARTAEVTGATQVGSEFSFVPAAGGAVPGGPSAGLQQNYLESLKWVEKLPW
jgi:hypothetical protein